MAPKKLKKRKTVSIPPDSKSSHEKVAAKVTIPDDSDLDEYLIPSLASDTSVSDFSSDESDAESDDDVKAGISSACPPSDSNKGSSITQPVVIPKPSAKHTVEPAAKPKPEPILYQDNDDSDYDSDPPPTLVSDSSSGEDSSDDEGPPTNRIPDLSNVKLPPKQDNSLVPLPTGNAQTSGQSQAAAKKQAQNQKKKEAKRRQQLKKKQREEEEKLKALEEERVRAETERRRLMEERIKEKRRQKSALFIQTVFRRYLVLKNHGEELKTRLKTLKYFVSYWGSIARILRRKPTEENAPKFFSWFEEKNRFDMVLYASDIAVGDEDVVLSDQQKIFQSVTTAEIRKQDQSRGAVIEHDEQGSSGISSKVTEMAGDFINTQSRELSLDELGISDIEDTNNEDVDLYLSETTQNIENVAAVLNVEFTETVMKWLQNADSRYRIMFSDRIERLAQGERSYMLAKRLKGCNSPVFETKLDRGQRILWTQLRRKNENPSIIVWFVSKHDKVPHFIQIMNKYFDRLKNALNTEGVVRSTGVYREGDDVQQVGDSVELTEDMCLLDPLRNSPLKIYTAASNNLQLVKAKKINVSKFPLRLNQMEKDVNSHTGTVLLLGRSGTGKTVCLCNRMSKDRMTARTISGQPISQLFVCRSRRLRDVVKRFYDSHCRIVTNDDEIDLEDEEEERRLVEEKKTNQANFYTLDRFIDNMDEKISAECGASQRQYERQYFMDYYNFRDNIYPELKYNSKPTKLDPLVLWTQIRTHIKGSFEAWKDTALVTDSAGNSVHIEGILSFEAYMNFEVFPPSRCRLDEPQRKEAYDLFTKYQEILLKYNMWDEADRVMDILLRFERNRDCEMNYTGKGGPYNKVYVDEIQDSTQAEITLLFLSSGFDFDSLMLAGDNAQSVVEGVDFRFEEVRSIMYALSKGVNVKEKKVNKPVTLVTNFRSHAGILNCATGILDMMFALFPHAAKVLERDRGFCKGPRPVYFFDLDHSKSILHDLLARNPRVVVLFRDEYDLAENDSEEKATMSAKELNKMLSKIIPEGILKLGIKDAKGMEFDDVVLIDFFSGLPGKVQDWWKKRFQNSAISPVAETQMPQMESLFKLLYTGVTRCCNRLIFVETQDKPASQAFFRWLKNKELAELYIPSDKLSDASTSKNLEYLQDDNLLGDVDVVYMSNDEWRLRGIELLLAAQDSRSNMKFFINAQVCFERAGVLAKNLKDKVQVQIDVEKLKNKFQKYFSTTRGGSTAITGVTTVTPPGYADKKPGIAEVAALVFRCVDEGFIQEASDLAENLKPCLENSSFIRLFTEEICNPLKSLTELRDQD